jgi:hypothetical protein
MLHERSRLRLRLLLFVVVGLVFGIVLLVVGIYISDKDRFWSQVLSAVGSAVFSSVALAALWEFWQKAAFTEEVLYRGEGMGGLRKAGVVSFSSRFQTGVPWDRLFKRTKEIDLFFTHASGWRSSNLHLLEEFSRRGGRIRVALPDPDNDALMKSLAVWGQWNDDGDLRQGVRDAAQFFIGLETRMGGA